MIVVISVNADGEPFGMAAEDRDGLCFAAIVIPRYEGNGCVKVVLFHLLEKTFVAEVPVRLAQPWIIDCQVCVMMESMPTSFPGAVFDKHHYGCDFRKRAFYILGTPFDTAVTDSKRLTKQEYLLPSEICLNKYRNDLMIVSDSHDFARVVLGCQEKVERILTWEWNLKV